MTAYKVSQDSEQGVVIAADDSLTLEAGISVIDPSVNLHDRTGLEIYAGIQDGDGGANRVSVLGTAEGFVGAWFWEGSDSLSVGSGGLVYGYNAGAEFHDGGHNTLTIRAGGTVSSELSGVWFGAFPHDDYTSLPDSGFNTIRNQGLIEGDRRMAIREVLGGNHIVNSGTIQANLFDAIDFSSSNTDPANAIVNSGTITAGPRGVAIVSGDAAMSILNTGQISGDIDFGAGNDRYAGSGTVSGTVFGGAGDDTLAAGSGAMTLCGGAGADTLVSGSGTDTFLYTAVSDSTKGVAVDTIDNFDFSKDHIVVAGETLTGFDHIASLHSLPANGSALIASSSGDWFVVVDANGVAGYQAGEDYMIRLHHPLHVV
jgi:Ca2+-binding RTX toxin-like protein